MLRLLVIDDEVIFHALVTRALEGHEWEISDGDVGDPSPKNRRKRAERPFPGARPQT